ncbi:dynactin subunit 6 [Halyomorpha halys]|uniref:dynactin subunit 6 n=1 Tax=Halyomorpha halys TaxID=286706 RepID=UPI0006D4F613|nr:dynactin subunit 6 [Halyomorpha halys]
MSGSLTRKDIQISKGAVVCVESKLQGMISIGAKTLVHPKASVVGDAGPIVIGESNIFEEQSVIHHRSDIGTDRPKTMVIGSNNVFEVGCVIHAKSIGDNNVFESKCYIGPDIEVGNGCIIGAGVSLSVKEKLRDNIVITGSEYHRAIAPEKPPPQTLQLDFLSKVLPNYHHLWKPK